MTEIRCEVLDDGRFREEADFVIGALEEQPDDILELQWGFGCNPLSWDPAKVQAGAIRVFLADAVGNGVFEFGRADAFITRPSDQLTITLCHENDIHLSSPKDRSFSRFTDRWDKRNICWFRGDVDGSDWTVFPTEFVFRHSTLDT